jgi:hypothetical protein
VWFECLGEVLLRLLALESIRDPPPVYGVRTSGYKLISRSPDQLIY